LYNINESNQNNRWVYSTKSDKSKFRAIMYILSLSVLLEFFIFEFAPEYIYRFLFYLTDIIQPEFVYNLPIDEINYIFYSIASIILSVIASSVTVIFLLIFLRRFTSEPEVTVIDKITYKFKLPENTLFLLIIGICIIQFSSNLSVFFNYFLEYCFGIIQTIPDDLFFPETVSGIILYFISIVVMPALIEEFMFRYIMLNALKKYGHTFAIVATSILFGFLHARTSAFFYATAIGFFLAYVAIKTKSIWFSVILHALVNFTAFIFQFVASLPITDYEYSVIYLLFLSVISFISLIYSLVLITKKKNLKLGAPENYTHIENKKKLIFFFNAAAIIFFILVIAKSAGYYGFEKISDNIMSINGMKIWKN